MPPWPPLLSPQPLGLEMVTIKPLTLLSIPSADVFPLLPHLTPVTDTVGCIFLLTCVKIIPLSPARYEFMLPIFFRHLQQLPCFVILIYIIFFVMSNLHLTQPPRVWCCLVSRCRGARMR